MMQVNPLTLPAALSWARSVPATSPMSWWWSFDISENKTRVGGLITAYKLAAAEALDRAVIIEKDLTKGFIIIYDYFSTPEVMKLVKDFELVITEQSFDEQCRLTVCCKWVRVRAVMDKFELLKTLGYIKHYGTDSQQAKTNL